MRTIYLGSLWLLFTCSVHAQNIPYFESLEACFIPLPAGYFEHDKAQCGYVMVHEDYTDPTNTHQMKIAVVIIHPLRADPKPDPVIFINGGPGAETLSVLNNLIFPIFVRPMLDTGRSVIVFDPRGVGFSEPNLNCPQRAGLQLPEAIAGEEADCLETLDVKYDLAVFHSTAVAADIDAIAQALNYEQVNLWGVSYGSRMALTTMRDFPHRVRAAILDSVVPLDKLSFVDYPAILEALFADCAAHEVCSEHFPQLRDIFFELVVRFNAEPVAYSSTRTTHTIWIDGYTFVTAILKMIDDTSQLASVPAAIYAAYKGDMNQIEANVLVAPLFPRGNVMGQVVVCNEMYPFETQAIVEGWSTALSDYFGFDMPTPPNQVEPCSVGEFRTPPLVEHEPVISDVPTLLLNGEYDSRTPPAFALHAAETLPNSFTYVLPYTGHAAITAGECSVRIMHDFLDDPTREPASGAACLELLELRFQWVTGK